MLSSKWIQNSGKVFKSVFSLCTFLLVQLFFPLYYATHKLQPYGVNRELPVYNYTVPEQISYSSLAPCADSVC